MLTITTNHQPATDLGYLLHKHPDRLQTFELPFGNTHVFYPEARNERCTAAMVLEMDPIRLTRRGGRSDSAPQNLIQEYVNDRPYAATSHLSTAIAKVFGTALSGRCDAMPELAQTPIQLEIGVASVRSHHGPDLIRRLFEPLGYQVETETPPMDPGFPEWGEGRHHNLTLKSRSHTLRETLVHLYVLLPAPGQRETLLDRKGRGGETPPIRPGLAPQAPGAGPHLPTLPGTQPEPHGNSRRTPVGHGRPPG